MKVELQGYGNNRRDVEESVKFAVFMLRLTSHSSFPYLRISGFTLILWFDRKNHSSLFALALEPNGLGRWPESAIIRFGTEP